MMKTSIGLTSTEMEGPPLTADPKAYKEVAVDLGIAIKPPREAARALVLKIDADDTASLTRRTNASGIVESHTTRSTQPSASLGPSHRLALLSAPL